jgi:hypothetical protein
MVLTAIATSQALGLAGQRMGFGPFEVDSLKNNAGDIAKVVDFLPTAVSSVAQVMTGTVTYGGAGTVVATINGVAISVATDTDAATTATALAVAINASANPLVSVVTALATGAGAYTLTADTPGLAFTAVGSATGGGNANPIVSTTANVDSTYTLTIGGVAVSYRGDASASIAEIRTGLIAAVEANTFTDALVTAAASGNNVRLTERDPTTTEVTMVGAATGPAAALAATVITEHSNEDPVPPGIAVTRGTADKTMKLMISGAAVVGVVELSHATGDSELDGDGLYPVNSIVPVIRKGLLLVKVEDAVTPASAVHVRHTPTADNPQRGAFRSDVDGGNAVALTSAQFKTSAGAGGLAQLSITLP